MRRIELEGVPRAGETVSTREGLTFHILTVERLECGDEPALARTPRITLHAQKPKDSNGLADRLAANGWTRLEDAAS